MGVLLFVRWINLLGVTLITLAGVEFVDRFGAAAIALSSVLSVFFVVAYGVFIERAVMSIPFSEPPVLFNLRPVFLVA